MRRLLHFVRLYIGCWLLASGLLAQTQLVVTVVDESSWLPVEDLKPEEFLVEDEGTVRPVASATYEKTEIADIVLLVDASVLGEAVTSLARSLIEQLGAKEQMAVVAYSNTAELVQDFTQSKELLRSALDRIQFGNEPQALDALYATILDAFDHSTFRRIILLVSSGVVAQGRVSVRSVIREARRHGVSIYCIYASSRSKSLLERISRETGAAPFDARELSRKVKGALPGLIFDVMRSRYRLTLVGSPLLSEKLEVKVRRKGKFFVSVAPAY